MIVQEVPEDQVGVDDLVLSPRGLFVRVTTRSPGELGVVRLSDGAEATVRPTRPVTVVVLTDLERSALSWDRRHLEALAGQGGRAARCSVGPFPTRSLRDAGSHLWVMHGVWVDDVKTVGGMVECHDAMHGDVRHLMAFAHHHIGR